MVLKSQKFCEVTEAWEKKHHSKYGHSKKQQLKNRTKMYNMQIWVIRNKHSSMFQPLF